MKKNTVGFIGRVVRLVVALAIGLATLSVQAQAACGALTETVLLAGQSIPTGSVVVENDGQYLYVTYRTDGNWLITETHLAVATRPEDLPQTPKGNAIPGQFAYQTSHDPGVTEVTHTIDVTAWPAGTPLYIAAHSVVVSAAGSETAWGDGQAFPGKNWAMYFPHSVQSCDPPPQYPGVLAFPADLFWVGEDEPFVTIEVQRTDGSDGAISVDYIITGETATDGSDYQATSGTLYFAEGETSKTFEIAILDDGDEEEDETIHLELTNVIGATLGAQADAQVMILDNDGQMPQ